MKIIFLSNYINHHQIGLCDELFKLCGESNFYFIQEENIPEKRLKLGYKNNFCDRPYVVCLNGANRDAIRKMIMDSDIIINTASQGLNFLKPAMKARKIVFWYSERLFKDYSLIKTIAKYFRAKYYFHGNPNQYHLLASSYGYDDMRLISKKWLEHSFEFGYFPITNSREVIKKNISSNKTINFLFAGRLIDWKHPEIVINTANYLKKSSVDYHITVVGNGPLKDKLMSAIDKEGFKTHISVLGSVPFAEMPKPYMNNDFLLFASDRREGWGAVLNEAMSFGCVPIANVEAGASRTLIKDEENGFIYNKMNFDDVLEKAIKTKIDNSYYAISELASRTIVEGWNYAVAAKKLYDLAMCIFEGKNIISNGNLGLLDFSFEESRK